ncbi:hypothetical protein P3683_24075, partial [Vibrio parahaemolyticus]|nr:hypothetical protein [Vibrio parahaemolyticus]
MASRQSSFTSSGNWLVVKRSGTLVDLTDEVPVTNSIFSPLSNPKVHRQVLALAIPMVLSNITVPL